MSSDPPVFPKYDFKRPANYVPNENEPRMAQSHSSATPAIIGHTFNKEPSPVVLKEVEKRAFVGGTFSLLASIWLCIQILPPPRSQKCE